MQQGIYQPRPKTPRKSTIFGLIALTLTGSFVNFYTTNLLLSDLSNLYYGVHEALIVSSLPGFFFSLDFVLGIL